MDRGSGLHIDERSIGKTIILSKPICAIQLTNLENGGRIGPLEQLGAGTMVELCGEGYNEQSVKVRAHGQRFFVFLQDL